MLLDTLHKKLSLIDRFTDEAGRLLRTAVADAAMSMDPDLLQAIKDEPELNAQFFTKVGETLVFDKSKFTWVVDSKAFLPDSYTAYKNKIGLVDGRGEQISHKSSVSLVWPFKDCILEGGQSKEEARHDEVFYNEVLSPTQV
ncbi:site-specific DNA-methyltransferase, partial [Corynebacterium casei]